MKTLILIVQPLKTSSSPTLNLISGKSYCICLYLICMPLSSTFSSSSSPRSQSYNIHMCLWQCSSLQQCWLQHVSEIRSLSVCAAVATRHLSIHCSSFLSGASLATKQLKILFQLPSTQFQDGLCLLFTTSGYVERMWRIQVWIYSCVQG